MRNVDGVRVLGEASSDPCPFVRFRWSRNAGRAPDPVLRSVGRGTLILMAGSWRLSRIFELAASGSGITHGPDWNGVAAAH